MIEWRKVAGQMRADLDRAALNDNARAVVAVLIKVTLMQGRTLVVLPDRVRLCELLGIHEQHMKRIWSEIEAARVATFRKVELGWECVLVADASQWACEFVYTRQQVSQWVDFVNRVPGQSQGSLLPAEPHLRQAIAETSAEAVSRGVPLASNKFGYSQPPPERQPVTNLVTRSERPSGGASYSTDSSTVTTALKSKAGKTVEQVPAEAALMKRLETLLASSPHASDREDMKAWGGHWRVRVVRADAAKFAAVLRIVEGDIKDGREARKSRAAWIKDLLKR